MAFYSDRVVCYESNKMQLMSSMACGKDIELMLKDNKRAVSVLKPVRLNVIGVDVAKI